MKTGLRQFTPQLTDIPADAVFTGTAPDEGGTHFTTGLGLLGNGDWGDCYWASAAREGVTLSRIAGRDRTFTETSVLDGYKGYLGVKTLTQQVDQGTDAREGAKYRVAHGVPDANGKGDRIGAYAFETDPHKIPALVSAFGAATLCIDLTEGNEQEFGDAEKEGRPFVWDLSHGTKVAGGHAIPVTYWTADGLGVNSWDREGIVTWDYLAKYMQTTVVYFSAAILGADGESPTGLDKAKLLEMVREVSG